MVVMPTFYAVQWIASWPPDVLELVVAGIVAVVAETLHRVTMRA
jgi:hypothetical protein